MIALETLQNWYASNCDGEWEHLYGIQIESLDNPGWYITIDLSETSIKGLEYTESSEKTDVDWYTIKTENNQLLASGDSLKLMFLLDKICEIIKANSPS